MKVLGRKGFREGKDFCGNSGFPRERKGKIPSGMKDSEGSGRVRKRRFRKGFRE